MSSPSTLLSKGEDVHGFQTQKRYKTKQAMHHGNYINKNKDSKQHAKGVEANLKKKKKTSITCFAFYIVHYALTTPMCK